MSATAKHGESEHVTGLLGLYHLGELSAYEAAGVRSHLAACAACRNSAVDVCGVLAALALLTGDRDDLLNTFGALGSAAPPPFPARFAPAEAEPEPRRHARAARLRRSRDRSGARQDPGSGIGAAAAKAAAAPIPAPAAATASPAPCARDGAIAAATKPVARTTPAAPRHDSRPSPRRQPEPSAERRPAPVTAPLGQAEPEPARGAPAAAPPPPAAGRGRERRPTRRIVLTGGLLIVTLSLATLGIGFLARDPLAGNGKPTVTAPPTVTATATDKSHAISMALTLTRRPGGAHVHVRVRGLQRGTGYRLFGNDFSGRSWPLAYWTADGAEESIDGEIAVGIQELSHFTIQRSDRTTVATAYLPR
ncbi:zf-HC2 domain-containing protein [Mangrovihabitans endophyticus]|uniref:Putative zinc-finger domain-containing protein n=1 Tax=Mangrovihabitans endophyticus TaxID=1751298 RepID=A0A8J3BW26_9ACTN|nr:zf-HC2 domain-containing protein [Mangrovihabitans endophyticus]GGK78720.1 hypothetical protein GCM10012284_10770 [Mangrovihabitans endophyticus]